MTQADSRPPAYAFVFLLVFGLILTAVLGYGFIWLPLRVNLFFQQTDCVVLDKRLEESESKDSDDNPISVYRPLIHIEYTAGGRPRQVWTYDATGAFTNTRDNQAILDQFQKGQRYPCWYDPGHPDSAVLTRYFSLIGLGVLIPLTFALIGAAGLIHRVRARSSAPIEPAVPSAKRAAAPLKARRAKTELANPSPVAGMEDDVWPSIPSLTSLVAGEELAYRLASSGSPAGRLLVALVFAVFWNGIVSIFVAFAIQDFMNGQSNWFLMLFLVPFVLIGLFLIIVVLAGFVDFLGSLLAGSLRVEIAEHPLHPGSSVDILVKQSGMVPLRNVRVTLSCEELARYTQGTDTSTAIKEVVNVDVLGPEPSLDGGLRGTFEVPGDAMHSFKAPHNEITWSLAVGGQILPILPYSKKYPIIVRPASGGVRP